MPTTPPDLRAFVGSPAPGLLPAPPATDPNGTLLLDLGPDHPTRAGVIELKLWLAGERISAADVVVGYLHRGVEKLFEVRDYRQILLLANRHDWQAPFAGELTVALAIEDLLGLAVPARATWLRTLLAEHTRIASHLGFLSWLAKHSNFAAGSGPARNALREQLLALTGNRVHPMICRVGGLAVDASAAWLRAEGKLTRELHTLVDGYATAIEQSASLAGLAPVTTDQINDFGLSGPTARGSGFCRDLRADRPYLAYPNLDFHPASASGSDAASRFEVLVQETRTSIELVDQLVAVLMDSAGPVAVALPRVIKLPEGETYLETEAPLGIAGVHLVSRGQPTPWRLRLRTPSAANVSALPSILPGVPVGDLEATLASIGYVVGDLDK